MHGTTLNDKKIEQMTEVALTNGDIIVFGAEVRRGPEVFPACSFKVDLAFAPYQSVIQPLLDVLFLSSG